MQMAIAIAIATELNAEMRNGPGAVFAGGAKVRRRLAAAVALGSVSTLYAVVTPLALWYSADTEIAAVWTLAITACSYLFLWTVFLTVTMRARTVFFSISYVALAAAAASHLCPYTGVFLAIIAMANAAGLFGYALAERRQHDGTERVAEAIPAPSSLSSHEREMIRSALTTCSLCAAVGSVACAAFGTWLSWRAVNRSFFVEMLSLVVGFGLELWVVTVTIEVTQGPCTSSDHFLATNVCAGMLLLAELAVQFVFGEAIRVLMYPLAVMYLAAQLGYYLAVYVRYNHMMAVSDQKHGAEPPKRAAVALDEIICISS